MSTEQPKPNPTPTPAAPIEKAVADGNLNLEQRITNVMRDVMDVKIKALELALDKKIDDILKSKEIEMEKALRKGFGLENDPVIHQSDIIAYMRKWELEKAETDKKTPAAVEKAGPEGNKPDDPLAKLMKQFGVA